MSQRTKTLAVYLLIAATTLLSRALLSQMPPLAVDPSQRVVPGWLPLTVLLFLGLFGLYFTLWLGLPGVIKAGRSWREILLAPAATGLIAGSGLVLWDLVFRLPEDLNVPFPYSIPFYYAGAVVVEISLHLLPLALLLGLGRLLLRDRAGDSLLWLSVLFVATLEPLMQFSGGFFSGYGPDFYIAGVTLVYFINLIQLIIFTRRGFLSMLVIRLAMYLVWYVLWGALRLPLLF